MKIWKTLPSIWLNWDLEFSGKNETIGGFQSISYYFDTSEMRSVHGI